MVSNQTNTRRLMQAGLVALTLMGCDMKKPEIENYMAKSRVTTQQMDLWDRDKDGKVDIIRYVGNSSNRYCSQEYIDQCPHGFEPMSEEMIDAATQLSDAQRIFDYNIDKFYYGQGVEDGNE